MRDKNRTIAGLVCLLSAPSAALLLFHTQLTTLLRTRARAHWMKSAPTVSDIPDLIRALKDPDPRIRIDAAGALGRIGPPAAPAVSALGDAIKGVDVGVTDFAAGALVRIGTAALPTLETALHDPDARVRRCAANALGQMGPPAAPAATALAAALTDARPVVRGAAAFSLGEIGPPAASCARSLARALADPSPQVRRDAAISLGQIGTGAASALPNLVDALKDRNARVRTGATLAVGAIACAVGTKSTASKTELHELETARTALTIGRDSGELDAGESGFSIDEVSRAIAREENGHMDAMDREKIGQAGTPVPR
ncbi:MAG: HEAT repeat domain-containing protein [Capsulimonadaceae bacterium]